MRKALLLSAILLLPSLMFAQSPPQIPLTGNIGVQGSVAILGGVTVPMPSDANYTLTPAQWSNKTLIITSTASLSAMRSIIAPLNKGQEYNIENNTTGGQSITITGASGTGVMIANGKAASVFFDGTNYIQAATLTVITAQTNELLAKATDGSLKSSGVFSDGVNSKSNIPFSAQADNGVINSDYFRSTPTSADAIPNTLNSSLCAAGCTFELTPTTTDLEQIPYQPTTSTPVSPILNSPANAGPALPYLIIDRRLSQANHTSAMAWNAINAGVDRFGAQAPFNFTTVNTRRVTASDGYYPLRVYSQLVSGGKNYSNQFDGANGTVFEKPNSSAFGMTLRKWTAGQEGGANSLAVQNLGTGDTVLRVTEGVATGISDGDDEGLEADRENIIYNTRRFGMVVSTITPDALGNYVFRGTRAAGYSEDPAEHLPVLNITKDKNTSQAGNIVDAVAYPADPRFLQLTPDSGGGIPADLGNSAVSFSTAVVTGAAPGNINANEWGVGSLSNVVVPVVDASAFTVSTSIPVCFSSQGDNFEMAHVTAVNIPGKTVTLDYIRDQHASNEMLAQGGGCGYAISMYADDTTIASLGRYGNDYANLTNSSTMHNAYYVLATIGGKYIVYTNSGATSNQLEWHTKAYMNTSPKVAGQLTATISGGSLATLTLTNASSVNYVGNTSSNLGFGQQVLAYPTITFTGGGCAVEPSVTVKGYAGSPFQTPQVPILSVPGDPGWSAGSGCTSAPTATMQTVYSNPYHLYPSTVSFRIIDPVTGQWTLGNYLMTESIRPSDWAVSDTLEISGWWNQQGGGGSSTVGKIFTGQSGVFGAARAWDFTGNWAYRDTLLAVNNSTPSQNYWSINGPSAGTAYEQPPDIWTIGGWSRVAFALEQPPMRAITSVTCGASANSGADSNIPCLNGVAQTYNLFELQRLGSQSIDIVSYNNGTNQITFNTLGGTLFGGPFSVNSLAGGLVKSGTGGLFSNATAGVDYVSPSIANTFTKTQIFQNSQDSITLGPELTTSTGWTLGSGWSGTFATGFTAVQGSGTLSFPVTTVVGTNYVLTYTLMTTSGGTTAVCPVVGGSSASPLNCAGAPPAQLVGFKSVNTSGGLVFTPSLLFTGTISNVSLKAISVKLPSTLNVVDSTATDAFDIRTGNTTNGNEFLGLQSGQFTTSISRQNTSVGSLALANEAVGSGNVAIGYRAMFSDWGSLNNVAIGANTLPLMLNTFGNTGVGGGTLPLCTQCTAITAIGGGAGAMLTNAAADILIGYRVAPTLTTGSNNIVIGGFISNTNVDVPTPTTSGYLNIGNGLTAQNINNTLFGGAFGVGKQLASYSLDVNGTIRSTGLIDFTSPPTVTPSTPGSTTYTYFVVAYLEDGTHTNPSPSQTITNGPSALSLTVFNTITWTKVANAAFYKVFQTAPTTGALICQCDVSQTTINDTGAHAGTPAPVGNNSFGIIVGDSQQLSSVQGAGSSIATFTGGFTNGHLVSFNAAGTEVDSGIATSDISALSGSLASLCHSDGTNCFSTVGNISAVTITASGATASCASGFTCKSNRGESSFSQPGGSKGSMTVTFGTAYTGTPVCSVVENGATDNTAHFFNWFATSSSLIIAPSIQDPTSYDTTLVYTCQP